MKTTLPEINEDFETAHNSDPLTPELRAQYVIAAFTLETLGSHFDLNEFNVNLNPNDEIGKYVLELELLPDAQEKYRKNFFNIQNIFAETKAAIEHEIDGPSGFTMVTHESGFALLTPDLNDFTTLYSALSEIHGLHWDDPKFCAKNGYDYSLADIKHAVAFLPEKEDEEQSTEMDRPVEVDRKLPRLWLQ